MQIEPTIQRTDRPAGAPLVPDPVLATPKTPLFYMGAQVPVPWYHPVFCAKIFAETVLETLDQWAETTQAHGLVHVGFYNPRPARTKTGRVLNRWSNHAYGCAVDFKGVMINDRFVQVDRFTDEHTHTLIESCKSAIETKGLKPEIVHEGTWLHIGYFPQ